MLKCTQLPANNFLRSGWGFTMPPNHSIHQHPPNRSCKMVRDMFNHISYQMSDDMLISTKHGINRKLHHITSAEPKFKTQEKIPTPKPFYPPRSTFPSSPSETFQESHATPMGSEPWIQNQIPIDLHLPAIGRVPRSPVFIKQPKMFKKTSGDLGDLRVKDLTPTTESMKKKSRFGSANSTSSWQIHGQMAYLPTFTIKIKQ